MAKKGGPGVFQISGARTGLTEDVRGRQRRYVISMAIRTLSVILTVVLWNVERPLAWGTLVVGALLPYVAVVFANAGRENAPIAPKATYIPQPVRRALEATTVESAAERGQDRTAEPLAEPSAESFGDPVGEPSAEPTAKPAEGPDAA